MRPARRPFAAALLTAAVALLAIAAPASAKLPATGRPFLVPNVGIGGAELGLRMFKGLQAWGTGGRCDDFGCQYTDQRRPELGFAQFLFEDGKRGKITMVSISLGSTNGKTVFDSPLTAFRTPSGVRLGATFNKVKKALPSARRQTSGGITYLTMRNRAKDATWLTFTKSRLVGITIQDGRPRG